MEYLKRFWNWLLSKTTLDEKVEAKVAEVKEEVTDVIEVVTSVNSDVSSQITKSGASPKSLGSGASAQVK
jgi:predicted RNA-binding protein with PIN domain